MEIVRLSDDHDLSVFDCGEDEIDRHIKWSASQQNKDNIATTYVAVDPAVPTAIHGFYSLRASELVTSSKPPGVKKLKSQAMPVVAVTHFGVQKASQGRRIGEMMLFDVFRRVQIISQHIGCHAVCLEALNDKVVGFYEKYDMKTYGLNHRN